MSTAIKTIDEQSTFISILENAGGIASIPKPFQDNIYLTSCDVAGTSYVIDFDEVIETLHLEDKVRFVREPNNAADKFAIRIDTLNGNKLGYIPRRMNHMPARLLDAGKKLYGVISTLDEDNWPRLRVSIYMED